MTAERDAQQHTAQHERLAAVGRLAAGIAHDFNNLLTVVIGYAEFMQERADLPKSVQNDLGIIVEQGRRGAHLVRQILGFGHQSRHQPTPFDLFPMLQEIGTILQHTLSESMHIVLDSVPGEYLIDADVGQFQQLLTNLALNARDAMPAGGELRFHLSHLILPPGEAPPSPAMPPGRWVVLAVSDTGKGMPPEVLHHIFEPFFTTKEKGHGAGLGLAQVYGIMQQHQGYITVQSQPGRGTTFTLYLPALMQPVDAEGGAISADMPQGQGETVLLVEDTPQVLMLLRLMLERLCYRVLTATDGQEALRVYERHGNAIALVIADLVMPKVGGVSLFQALRKRAPGIKVVILTGYLPAGRSAHAAGSGDHRSAAEAARMCHTGTSAASGAGREARSRPYTLRQVCHTLPSPWEDTVGNVAWKTSEKFFLLWVLSWLSSGLSCGSPQTS